MMTLPLVLNGSRCRFVIIGGGQVAERKVRSLVKAGAVGLIRRNWALLKGNIPLIRKGLERRHNVRGYDGHVCTGLDQ